MNDKRLILLSVLVTGIVAGLAVKLYAELTATQKPLVGLMGIYVLVEDLDDVAKGFGLTKPMLKADVEQKLRRSSIKVISEREWRASEDSAYLHVIVKTIRNETQAVTNVIVRLREQVYLARNDTETIMATTWIRGYVSLYNQSQYPQRVRSIIKDRVDQFTNDYVIANPR